MSPLEPQAKETPRCGWCAGVPEFLDYHDYEWGYPVADDRRLFEKICLESFQAGLSWRTILNKRDNFRAALAHFDFYQLANFQPQDIEALLQNSGIVRHRGKLEAVINNAGRACELVEEVGSLAAFFWQFEPEAGQLPEPQTQTMSPASHALSKALKKRGWKFVGPTTVYAFMQAMGLINDHATSCAFREKAEAARRAFVRPC
ncbi:DNA-3-methyladenine glycosylase I [Marinospirillum perlucidum]|uniref:DNA-3-methyladenine glycosylase I n=1 Tax=Marinospirillum perlucidum TaxID=1982602 RepID=UPI000DF35814|nr:DNA-3-methyladenine glycosylase I [Marinospirillum perlucidum]